MKFVSIHKTKQKYQPPHNEMEKIISALTYNHMAAMYNIVDQLKCLRTSQFSVCSYFFHDFFFFIFLHFIIFILRKFFFSTYSFCLIFALCVQMEKNCCFFFISFSEFICYRWCLVWPQNQWKYIRMNEFSVTYGIMRFENGFLFSFDFHFPLCSLIFFFILFFYFVVGELTL